MEKNGLKVLVTGASRGIGRSICERLDADGYEVVGIARNRPEDWPEHMAFHSADLSERETVKKTLAGLAESGPFYGLVNNVGFVPIGTIENVDTLDLQRAIALNVEVDILCAQALLAGMRAEGKGRIINISSRAALGKQGRTLYSMTKAGVIGMTRTWALELAGSGITVNAIAPGPIATEFFQGANDQNDEATRKLLAGIPVGRIGQPQDVAHAVAYFIDPRCGFVTGQTHYVCGGITIGAA
ncbi:SDR family oxidoreductase [Allopusillimonas soli]|uniref:SDR family oxidoreductase n=1 Tax=Allopusillimonas soli TaxID=659016 RepID=A0A853F9X4_9BURK|nr:SDR family oxidoreductase [Allopusillimonas soli]NYT36412.1 SDR family oxidoreductase [Allopusillimonas soli]TEA74924.1 SDR family oxidoreductase [Allopusillimonas soli]